MLIGSFGVAQQRSEKMEMHNFISAHVRELNDGVGPSFSSGPVSPLMYQGETEQVHWCPFGVRVLIFWIV